MSKPSKRWDNLNTPARRKLVFKNGRPLGAERKDNLAIYPSTRIRTYEDLSATFNYTEMARAHSWAKTYKSGIILIHINPVDKQRSLLLVRQRESELTVDGVSRAIPQRFGPPKGSREKHDRSALDTAIREMREETGINILDKAHGVHLMPSVFMIRRPEDTIQELHIYFVAIVNHKPTVQYDQSELCGYMWIDMSALDTMTETTAPIHRLLLSLGNIYVNDNYEDASVTL